MAINRYYSAIAQDTTITSGITSSSTTVVVAGTTGYPTSYPFALALDYGSALEEIVDVTGVAGLTLTITRAVNGTTAVAHAAGATVRHVITARDLTDAQTHYNTALSAGAHGITGALATFFGSTTSANLASVVTDETGSGSLTFATNPTITSPVITDLTTKGDLIAGTGSGVITRLAVGSDGQTLVANSSASTGVSWAGPIYTAGKNGVINGGFDIWQRGTTQTGSLYGYQTADRWFMTSTASMTTAQESTTVPVGSRYSMKTTCGGSSATISGYQAIETYNAIQFAGKTVTFSGYFQSSTTPTVQLYVEYSTGVDTALTGTWTSATNVSGGSGAAGASSFARISGVWSIPSTAQSVRIWWQVPLSASQIVYAGQLQLELGSVATTFSRAGGTLQGELAACQRYYWRTTATGSVTNAYQLLGVNIASTIVSVPITFPVEMRVAPSTIDYSNLGYYVFRTATSPTISSINCGTPVQTKTATLQLNTTGLTINDAGILNQSNASSYLGLSAEL